MSDNLPTVSYDIIQVRQFEQDWDGQSLDRVAEFAAAKSKSDYQSTLMDLLSIDVELAWRRWAEKKDSAENSPGPITIETYLQRFPELENEEILRQLVAIEFAARRRHGEQSQWSDYHQRFPTLFKDQSQFEASIESRVDQETKPFGGSRDTHGWSQTDADRESPISHDYEIIEKIAQGGMGIVYKAKQKSLGRTVALKTLRSGFFANAEDLLRFRNEAEAVALLDHPNIVPVYDYGDFDGQPFLAMKFISGGTLTSLCVDLVDDPRHVAKLLIEIANAVQHAHQRGVLHRDLKPANILIDETGEPFITDFGLAKRLDQDIEMTRADAIVGTPGYMAPEQTDRKLGEVTTVTDVYGLGSIMYVLLTGKMMFPGSGVLETIQAVRNKIPTAPHVVRPSVPRDLSAVCMKCLEKLPEHRYASPRDLALDLQRWLDGRPVEVSQPGALRRAWLWSRRNPKVSVLSAALVLAIVVGVSGIVWKWLESESRRAKLVVAEKETSNERDEALATLKFLQDDLLMQADPEMNARDSKVTVEELLDRAANRIDHAFADRPRIAAQLKSTIGGTYESLGEFDKADPLLKAALESYRNEVGENDQNTLDAMGGYGALLRNKGKIKESRNLLEEAYQRSKSNLGEQDKTTLQLLSQLALTVKADGDLQESERLCKMCLDARRELLGPKHRDYLDSLNNFAAVLYGAGKSEESITAYEECLETMCETLGPEHPNVLVVINNLAAAYQAIGNLPDAEQMYRDSLALREKVLGPEHPGVFLTMGNLAVALEMQGRLDESIELYERCLELGDRIHGENHPSVLRTRNNLGMALLALGEFEQSGAVFEKCRVGFTEVLGESHPLTRVVQNNLSNTMISNGKYEEAEPILASAVAGLADKLGETHSLSMKAFHNQVLLWIGQGKIDEAEHAARENLARRRESLPTAHRDIGDSLVVLGRIQLDLGQNEEAQRLLGEATSIYQKEHADDHWKNGEARFFLALANSDVAVWKETQRELTEALSILRNAAATPKVLIDDVEKRFAEFDSEDGNPGNSP